MRTTNPQKPCPRVRNLDFLNSNDGALLDMLCTNMYTKHPKLTGFIFAILSAATFGSSGVLAKGLILSGWSPAAVVIGCIAIGGLVLFIPAIRSLRGRDHLLKSGWPILLFFGAFTIATSQLAYFLAVERLNVAVAVLLLYLGVLLVVL